MSRGIDNNAPRDAGWLARELFAMKQQLTKALSGRRILNSAQIDEGGLTITNGGALSVIDPSTGTVIAYIGSSAINDGSGRQQMVVHLTRADGTAALQMADNGIVPGHAFQQALQWYDRANNVVVADDTISGTGLARPHIDGGGMLDTNTSRWPSTSATTFTTIANRYFEIQNPLLTWQIQMYCDAGITAQYRMMLNGNQIGTTQSVAAASFGFWSTNAAPPSGVKIGDVVLIELQAKASATTASARAQCLRLSGQQSS